MKKCAGILLHGLHRKIRFGLTISGHELLKSIELGVCAEKFRFDSVWVPDHLVGIQYTQELRGSLVDPWVALAAIGVHTRRVFLGSAVTDGLRAHPAKLAQTVSTLDELTAGRAVLGVGAGEAMNIKPFGMEWGKPRARAERLKEVIEVIRLLWKSSRRNPANYTGKYYRLRDAFLDQHFVQTPHPPIYVGAVGSPLTLEITGRIGNGWFPYINTPELYARKIERIKKAAESVGRGIEEIDTAVWLDVLLSKDSEEIDRAVQKVKLLLVVERNAIKQLGHEMVIPEGYSTQNVYGLETGQVCNDRRVVDAADNVPEELVHDFSAIGDEEHCIEKIEEFVRAGASHIAIRDLGPNVPSTLEAFASEIIPHFRDEM